ncbi:MAG TPA: DegV family protein [Anaerolineaceae bacterium]|nr:DegV family protein [Anaerolineaceae bacterium]HQH86580.1 DegV family protein [Anaerolineaceae bacterium]
MLRIVTDGAVDCPAEWRDEYGIDVLPLYIQIGDQTLVEGVNVSVDNFYGLVEKSQKPPKTSLPAPAQIVAFYRQIARPGDSILSIHIASKMSGTFAAVQLAAREVASEFSIHVFDSGAGSAALGFMCREARRLERAGASIQKTLQRLEQARQQLSVIFTLDTLYYAYISGRISALKSAMGMLLRIKPIIVLRDGLLQMSEKVRTRSQSLDHIIQRTRERIKNQPVDLAIVHAAAPEAAQELLQKVRQFFNVRDVIVTQLSLPVAANLGRGAVGIVAYPVLEEG